MTANGIWRHIKSYRFNSIFLKNLLLIFFLVFIPLMSISVSVYVYLNRMAVDEAGAANHTAAVKSRDIIDMIVLQNGNIVMSIASDPQTERLLTFYLPKYPDYSTMERYISLKKQMSTVVNVSSFVQSVYFYSERNNYILSSNSGGTQMNLFYDNAWKAQYDEKSIAQSIWVEFRNIKEPSGLSQSFITTFVQVPLFGTVKLGCVAINLNADKVAALVENYSDDIRGNMFIVESDGTILYHSDKGLLQQNLYDIYALPEGTLAEATGYVTADTEIGRVSIAFVDSAQYDWKYVSIIPMRDLDAEIGALRNAMMTALITMVLLTATTIYIVSLNAFRPLTQVLDLLKNLEEWGDNLPSKNIGEKVNELKFITNNIIGAFIKGKKMEAELAQRSILLKKAQTIALQAQINPHFLFNTLETVNWMVMQLTGDENDISFILTSLSHLLRVSFATQEGLISVQEEIENARCYLDIQKFRYADTFDVMWDIDETILPCKISKIVLQPLIENAIYHGLKPQAHKGLIRISGYSPLGGDDIILSVADNGVGMTPERCNALSDQFLEDIIKEDDHIGLSNVNRRLKLIFGEAYGLSIESAPQNGTVVKIRFPKTL